MERPERSNADKTNARNTRLARLGGKIKACYATVKPGQGTRAISDTRSSTLQTFSIWRDGDCLWSSSRAVRHAGGLYLHPHIPVFGEGQISQWPAHARYDTIRPRPGRRTAGNKSPWSCRTCLDGQRRWNRRRWSGASERAQGCIAGPTRSKLSSGAQRATVRKRARAPRAMSGPLYRCQGACPGRFRLISRCPCAGVLHLEARVLAASGRSNLLRGVQHLYNICVWSQPGHVGVQLLATQRAAASTA